MLRLNSSTRPADAKRPHADVRGEAAIAVEAPSSCAGERESCSDAARRGSAAPGGGSAPSGSKASRRRRGTDGGAALGPLGEGPWGAVQVVEHLVGVEREARAQRVDEGRRQLALPPGRRSGPVEPGSERRTVASAIQRSSGIGCQRAPCAQTWRSWSAGQGPRRLAADLDRDRRLPEVVVGEERHSESNCRSNSSPESSTKAVLWSTATRCSGSGISRWVGNRVAVRRSRRAPPPAGQGRRGPASASGRGGVVEQARAAPFSTIVSYPGASLSSRMTLPRARAAGWFLIHAERWTPLSLGSSGS